MIWPDKNKQILNYNVPLYFFPNIRMHIHKSGKIFLSFYNDYLQSPTAIISNYSIYNLSYSYCIFNNKRFENLICRQCFKIESSISKLAKEENKLSLLSQNEY